MADHRCHIIEFRQADDSDRHRIERLQTRFGEGNVDLRSSFVLTEAIRRREFHVATDSVSGEIVGTGAIYPYAGRGRVYIELGTSVIDPDYRGLGIADVSVALRSIYSMLVDPHGSLCVSEIYPLSIKSRRVLERMGYVSVPPDPERQAHAAAVSAEPVLHLELPAPAIAGLARTLLRALEGEPIIRNGHQTYFCFSKYYLLHTASMRTALGQVADGDLSALGYTGLPRRSSRNALQPELHTS